MSNILLITNTENIIDAYSEKLALLRNGDKISYCNYDDAPDVVFANSPDIVILHEHETFEKTLNLIKYLKIRGCCILLLINEYNSENVLNAYDEGIDDYFYLASDASEILIRIVNCIKKQNIDTKITEFKNILKKYGIISENTGFYSKKCALEVCDEEFNTKDYSKGALTLLSFDPLENSAYSLQRAVSILKETLRFNDLIVNAGDLKFYLINKNYGVQGALTIVEKIKNKAEQEYKIKAGICEIKKQTFQQAEKKVKCALSEAMLSGVDTIVYAKPDSLPQMEDWLGVQTLTTDKNYKLFKQLYAKKLKKVIEPVFYRAQKECEADDSFAAKTEQFTDERQCVFRLAQGNSTGMLKILYEGMAKVKISIIHAGLESPENRELTLNINKITTRTLSEIMESFINEFKTTI